MLLSIEHYQKLIEGPNPSSIVDLLAMPEGVAGTEDVAFDPLRARELFRPADLSSPTFSS